MTPIFYPARYKDQPAITLESAKVAAQFLPGIGAKMCSLIYKPVSLELLLQRPNETYRLAPYDGDYVAQGECSGFDEMFPSIDRCFYEGYPWRGTPIPDHGEVWSIPWAWDDQDGRLHLVTHGVRFPYRLEKWVSFADDATLRTDYRLTNLSGFDLDFMWASPHDAEPGRGGGVGAAGRRAQDRHRVELLAAAWAATATSSTGRLPGSPMAASAICAGCCRRQPGMSSSTS